MRAEAARAVPVPPAGQQVGRDFVGLQGRYPQPGQVGFGQDAGQQRRQVDAAVQVKAVGAELRAGKGNFLETGRPVAADGGDDVVWRDAALAPPHFGDDAVGADLIAALLYFDHRPAAAQDAGGSGGDVGVRPGKPGGPGNCPGGINGDGAGGVVPGGGMPARQFRHRHGHQLRLVGVAHHQGHFGQGAQFGGGALGIAAGGDDDGIGMLAAGGAQGLSGFGIGGGGYRAGVDHHHIGAAGRRRYGAAAGRGKLPRQRAAVGLVQLAAVGFNGHGGRLRRQQGQRQGCGGGGHRHQRQHHGAKSATSASGSATGTGTSPPGMRAISRSMVSARLSTAI